MSLRVRLTLLTSVLVMVASILIAIAAYAAASAIQYGSIDRTLAGAIVDVRLKGLTEKPRLIPADVYNPVAVAVVDSAGTTTVLRQAGFGAQPLGFPTLTPAQVSEARSGPVTIPGEPSYRVLANAPNGRRDTILVATPLTSVEDDLARQLRATAIAVVLVTAVGALLSWLLVGRSLRPVDEMAETAQSIAGGELTRRVPEARPGTELGDLASALNAMIGSLTASLEEVRASEIRLRAFVSDASHEIRTPLTVIRGYTELLQKSQEPRTDLERRALERLGEESRRLESLVSQLLLLERAGSGGQEDWAEFDLSSLVVSAVRDFETLHPERPFSVRAGSTIIRGSQEGWRQIITNLLQNVGRYTPAASPVSVEVAEGDGWVSLRVDDAGPGIPATRRTDMLSRFTRLDDSRSADTGGAGLGLSIVKAVVEAHDGEIALTDSPLGGLRVEITAPSRPPLPGEQEPAP